MFFLNSGFVDVGNCSERIFSALNFTLPRLLAHEPQLLLILSTHTADLHDACSALLRAAGFVIIETSAVALARAEGWAALGDVDLLAYRPTRPVSAAAQAAFAQIGRAG